MAAPGQQYLLFQNPCRDAAARFQLVSERLGCLYAVSLELRLKLFFGQAAQLVFKVQGVDGVEDICQSLIVGRRRGIGFNGSG